MNTLIRNIICACVLPGVMLPVLADMSQPEVAAADIGRLFMSPAERSRIDVQRARGAHDDISVQSDTPAPVKNTVVVNGWVKRGSGVNAVWVNGEAVAPGRGNTSEVVVLRGPGRDKSVVIGRSNGKRAVVKPGQSWNLLNDKVEECADCNAQDSVQVEPEIHSEPDAESALAGL